MPEEAHETIDDGSWHIETPPPARGVRPEWQAVPAPVRAAVEQWLGSSVVAAVSQPAGFTPGVAARLRTKDGRRVFVKAAGPEPNPITTSLYRREARIVAALPAGVPVPRLLWQYDPGPGGWVVLVFEDVQHRHPAQPWRLDELDLVRTALVGLAADLTPSPLPAGIVGTANEQFGGRLSGWRRLRDERPSRLSGLDEWSTRHLEQLVELEAAAESAVGGDTLLHLDVRADNILITPERVWFVDWPEACVGAAWIDMVFFAPSVTMQGGPSPEDVIARHPACQAADADDLTVAVAAVAGYFTHRALQPPAPGLPTLRAFQAAQGAVAREWLAERAMLK